LGFFSVNTKVIQKSIQKELFVECVSIILQSHEKASRTFLIIQTISVIFMKQKVMTQKHF